MKLFSSIIHSRLLYKILCGILFCSCTLKAQTPKYFTSTPIWGINLNCNGFSIESTSKDNYIISGGTLDPVNILPRVFISAINLTGEFTNFTEYIKQDSVTYAEKMVVNYTKKQVLIASVILDTAGTSYQSYFFLTNFDGSLIREGFASDGFAGFETSTPAACLAFDGGYIVAGQRSAAPIVPGGGYVPYHPYVVKLDSLGNRQWDKLYTAHGPPLFAWIKAIQPAPNGSGYFLLGTTGNGVVGDVLLIKIDTAGNELWHKRYDLSVGLDEFIGEQGMSVLPTSDGGLVITVVHRDLDPFTGCCPPFNVGRKGVFIKTDSVGNVIWDTIRMTIEDDSDEIIAFHPGTCLVETADGHYVSAGTRTPLAGQLDGELVKVSKAGKVLWRRTYDIDGFDDYIYDMIPSADGGFVMCGRSETVLPPWGLIARMLFIKANCMGLLTQPQAAFTHYPIDNHAIQFINQTQYAYPDSIDGGYYIWDFGDGTPPYLCGQGYEPCAPVLTHQYALPGAYTATLTAIVCTDTSVVQHTFSTQAVGTEQAPPLNPPLASEGGSYSVVVYPNPAQNTLHFTLQNSLTPPAGWSVSLFTPAGQRVLHNVLSPVGTPATASIQVGHLPVGMYFYTVQSGGAVLARGKVAVVR